MFKLSWPSRLFASRDAVFLILPGYTLALDVHDGHLLWNVSAVAQESTLSASGMLYLKDSGSRRHNFTLRAFDRDGEVWSYKLFADNLDEYSSSIMTHTNGTVDQVVMVVAFTKPYHMIPSNDTMFAIENGKEVWSLELNRSWLHCGKNYVLRDGTILYWSCMSSSPNHTMEVLAVRDGKVLSSSLPVECIKDITLTGNADELFIETCGSYVADHSIVSLDNHLAELWRHSLVENAFHSVV